MFRIKRRGGIIRRLVFLLLILVFAFVFIIQICHHVLFFTDDIIQQKVPVRKTLCPLVSPYLIGSTNLADDISFIRQEKKETFQLKMKQAGMLPGGRYRPKDCATRHKIAIVVPFREREEHLGLFLGYMHPFLQRQQLDYVLFAVEQTSGSPFNRGQLMNIGFKEVLLHYGEYFSCFIFHDVDLLPEDDRNTYTCPEDGKPRHMTFKVDIFNYETTPPGYFGGVVAMTAADFRRVNGFSNVYWGWGKEDDDLYRRVILHNLTVTRPYLDEPSLIHRMHYRTLYHAQEQQNPERHKLFDDGSLRMHSDGLNNLNYKRLAIKLESIYTHLLVDIQQS